MYKKQDAEIENEGSAQKYMPQSEIDEQRSSLLIMTQHLLSLTILLIKPPKTISIIGATMYNIVATILNIVLTKIGIVC